MRIIAGQYRNRRLLIPKGSAVRPTPEAQRERLFNMIQGIVEGAKVLDLFAGSGAITFEALSRGAAHVTCVERDARTVDCIRRNAELLGVGSSLSILAGDVFRYLPQMERNGLQFDLIIADPPFYESIQKGPTLLPQHLLEVLDRLHLLQSDGYLFIEHATNQPLDHSDLRRLVCKNSRRVGQSTLDQFVGITNPERETL